MKPASVTSTFPSSGDAAAGKSVDPSINAGWQNASFKNYADYTLTSEYQRKLTPLITRWPGYTGWRSCAASPCHGDAIDN